MLGSALESRAERLKQNAAEKAKQAKLQELGRLFQGEDADALSAFMIANPDMRDHIEKSVKFKDDAAKASEMDLLRRAAAGEVSPTEYFKLQAEQDIAEGKNADRSIAQYKDAIQNPEAALKQIEKLHAIYDPTGYTSLKKATAVKAEPSPKTLIEAWLKKNPDAKTEDILKFATDLEATKAKKAAEPRAVKAWTTPEGEVVTLPNNVKPPAGSVPYTAPKEPGVPAESLEDKGLRVRREKIQSAHNNLFSQMRSVISGENILSEAMDSEAKKRLVSTIQQRMDNLVGQYSRLGGDVRDLGVPGELITDSVTELEAQLPAAENKGRTARDPDTGKRYTSDGTTWIEVQ